MEWIVSSTVLATVVIGLRYALRGKISLRLQYGLWLLVLLRLLIPVSFGGAQFSVANAAAPSRPLGSLSQRVVTYVGGAAPEAAGVAAGLPQVQERPNVEKPVPAQPELETAGGGTPVSVGDILLWVWIAGGAAAAMAFLWSNLRFRRRLCRSRKPLAAEGAALRVYVTAAVETPCLFGLFRPAVYVTPEAAEDPAALPYVLAHEATHFRRGDHIWSLLRCAALVLHWYNPLVWWASALSRRDGELACDEAAVARLGESRRAAYGRTILRFSCRRPAQLLVTATTMTGSAAGLKERIQLLAKRPKTTVGILLVLLVLGAVAAGCTFTGAADPETTAPEGAGAENEGERLDDPAAQVSPEGADVPQAVKDWAGEILDMEQRYYAHLGANPPEGGGYTIADAKITGLTEIPLGTAATEQGLHLYLLEFRITPDDPDAVTPVGGMRMEDGAITEWNYDGQPCLLLRETDEGWERLGSMSTDRMSRDYGGEELVASYGDVYTAAAVECSQGRGCGQEQLAAVLAGLPEQPVRLAMLTDAGVMGDADGTGCTNAAYFSNNLGSYRYLPVAGHISGEGVRIQILGSGEGQDWTLIYYDDSPYMALTTADYDSIRFCAVPQYEGDWAGDLARQWYDEAELRELGGGYENQDAIVIPDEGQGYLAAAQQFCQTLHEINLTVSSGSMFRYTFVDCTVEAAEETTRAKREQGEIGGNTWAFYLKTAFVPENQAALNYSMAGNTGAYEGGDPNVPDGAYEYSRCGYITLEDDGWHGELVGTGW